MNRRDFLCGITGLFAGASLHALISQIYNIKYKPNFLPVGLSIAVTHHCNLNCKSCDQFAPLCKEEFLDVNQFEEDFRRLKKLYNADVYSSAITGGEPLLNPELEKIIEKLFVILPNSKIAIFTNGILLNEKDDSFWKLLKKHDVILSVSKYPINIDRNKYEKKAKEYDVRLIYKDLSSNNLYDYKTKKIINPHYNHKGNETWGKPVLDLSGSQNYKEKLYSCVGRGCYMYARGNLYFCTLHANLNAFADYFNLNIPFSPDDYLTIANVVDRKEIDDFFSRPNSLCRFCKYCHDICYGKQAQPWAFSERKLSEWT